MPPRANADCGVDGLVTQNVNARRVAVRSIAWLDVIWFARCDDRKSLLIVNLVDKARASLRALK